jgi:hypothetical protein
LTENSFDPTDGYLTPIGNRNWWVEGEAKSLFDQQTIEAGAYAELYHYVTYDLGFTEYEKYINQSRNWFLGENVHRMPIYVSETGGCHDSLNELGVNLNQGAESVLSYLLAESVCSRSVLNFSHSTN